MTKFANFSGVGSNVRPPAQYLGEALKQFQGTVTGIQDRAQQQANKEIEQQRLADALALQQQEAKNSAAYREGRLGLQRKSNELAEAQALRNNVTNKYMSDILASKDKAEAQTKLAKYRNDAMFSPDANAQQLLSSYLNPEPAEYKGDKYYKALDGGGYTVVNARSLADEEALIKAGYLRGNPEGTGSGKSSGGGGTDSDKITGELALYRAIGNLGNDNTVYKAVEAARAANVPFNVINNWVAAKGGYNPETGLLEPDWGKRDIDVSDLNKITEEFIKRADTSLGNTKKGVKDNKYGTAVVNGKETVVPTLESIMSSSTAPTKSSAEQLTNRKMENVPFKDMNLGDIFQLITGNTPQRPVTTNTISLDNEDATKEEPGLVHSNLDFVPWAVSLKNIRNAKPVADDLLKLITQDAGLVAKGGVNTVSGGSRAGVLLPRVQELASKPTLSAAERSELKLIAKAVPEFAEGIAQTLKLAK